MLEKHSIGPIVPPKAVEIQSICQKTRERLQAVANGIMQGNGVEANKLKTTVDELVEEIKTLNPCQE